MSTTPVTSARRQDLLARVLASAVAMDARYSKDADYSALFRLPYLPFGSVRLEGQSLKSYPLLYWGDPVCARFATFGLIPSADEFRKSRQWPDSMSLAQLDDRSVNYFNHSVPPNDWFDRYDDRVNKDKALNILCHSYQSDTVHLDLTPRAMIAVGKVNEKWSLRKRFLEMAISDLRWFVSALALSAPSKETPDFI